MRITAFIGATVAALALTIGAEAAPVKLGSLTLDGFWTTATPPGAPTAAGYLTITNTGSVGDSLVAVTSPDASIGMLHRMDLANGIATMAMVQAIDIAPGKTVTLAPDGFHIMFVTLKQQLKAGGTFPVTLVFQKAGRIDVSLPVLALGAKGPAAP